MGVNVKVLMWKSDFGAEWISWVVGRKNWSMFRIWWWERLESREVRRFEAVIEEGIPVWVPKSILDLAERTRGSRLPSKDLEQSSSVGSWTSMETSD